MDLMRIELFLPLKKLFPKNDMQFTAQAVNSYLAMLLITLCGSFAALSIIHVAHSTYAEYDISMVTLLESTP